MEITFLVKSWRTSKRNLLQFWNTKFAVGVNSGTSALHLALLAAGVGPGSEVITVPFTFVASVATIRLHRGTSGFCRRQSGDLSDGCESGR